MTEPHKLCKLGSGVLVYILLVNRDIKTHSSTLGNGMTFIRVTFKIKTTLIAVGRTRWGREISQTSKQGVGSTWGMVCWAQVKAQDM